MTHDREAMKERARARQEVRSAYEMGVKVSDIAKAQSMSLRDVYAILKAQDVAMRRPPVSESIARILDLRNKGWSVRQIERETGHHRDTIGRVLYRQMVDGDAQTCDNPQHEDRPIHRNAKPPPND